MVNTSRAIHIVIVAAGTGNRFGSDLPKQFCDLCGKPVLAHVIETFSRAVPDATVTLVLSAQGSVWWRDWCADKSIASPDIVIGGSTRSESVYNALKHIIAGGTGPSDMVLIHDGARPLLTSEVIHRVVEATSQTGAAIPVTPVVDSLRHIEGDSSRPVDRSALRAVQTPQGFNLEALYNAYCQALNDGHADFTDDASLIQAFGHEVVMVDGSPYNIKITNPADIVVARALLGCT